MYIYNSSKYLVIKKNPKDEIYKINLKTDGGS